MERLTLRAEAGSWPLWDDTEGDAVDPESFDMSPELLADLDAWTMRLDQADGWFEDEQDRIRFDVEGRRIWERMAGELRGQVELGWAASFSDEREAGLS